MSKPYISILIDTYNHERFIEQAIVSVLEQEVSPTEMEVIVVDDGSTDNTAAIVHKFAPRVRYLFKKNGGQASAFNAGIPEMHGPIVTFLDGDDWWEKEKLPYVLEAFEKNPEVGVVGHGLFEVDEAGTRRFSNVPDRRYHSLLHSPEEARQFRELKSFLGTSRLALRSRVLERILPVPEALAVEADEFLATVGVACSGAIVLDRPLTNYRLHSGNLFQFRALDPVRVRRKHVALACLLRELGPRLATLGVSQKVIDAILEPTWIDSERMRLYLYGGNRWETFRVERAAFRLAYKQASHGYLLFHCLVLGTLLILPPRRFYRLRHWYAQKGLHRLRKLLGEPTPADSLVERRTET